MNIQLDGQLCVDCGTEENVLSSMVEVRNHQDGLHAACDLIGRNRPDLEETSGYYRAAIILLLAPVVGRGVHKLAKVTGYPTEFVARCARRLVDNGVWPDDQPYLFGSFVSDWNEFWLDVEVAEGKLCRRRDESGELQWAPPGQWWKEFDFSIGTRNVAPGVVRYQPATVVPTTLLRDGMSDEDEVEVDEEPELEILPELRNQPRVAARPSVKSNLIGAGNVVVLGGSELPDTCWLS